MLTDGAAVYAEAFGAGLRPEPDWLVSEWADEHRVLAGKAASEPGPYRTSRTPYLREVMDCLSPRSGVEEVYVIKGTQVGASEAGNNWIGYIIDQAPGPAMIVQPTVDLAKRFSKQRIAPLIAETPRLRAKVRESRSRDSGNTTLSKEFPGGMLVLTGANSAVGLRSMPARYLFEDELDAYPLDVDGEGDPESIVDKRADTFARRKRLKISTPLDKATSRVEPGYERSERPGRYHVPCPHCGHLQWLRWAQLRWEQGRPDTVRYVCESCEAAIDEHHKTTILDDGQWLPPIPEGARTVGFHVSALYSPLGWKSWESCVREFLDAKRSRDPRKLKTFINTVLAETWEEEGESLDESALYARREDYTARDLPEGVLCLTAGVDVQDDRLEYEVVGWGEGFESWGVETGVLWGPPSGPKVWEQLDDLLLATRYEQGGQKLRISATGIDSGHLTQQVYRYCRERYARRVYCLKGIGGAGRPLVGRPTRSNKLRVRVFPVGTDTAKEVVYSRLKIEAAGPGHCHFPVSYDEEYFDQLGAERIETRYHKGFATRIWVKTRPRNEALDNRVYSTAAVEILNPRFLAIAGRRRPDPEAEPAGQPTPQPKRPSVRSMRPQRQRFRPW